MVHSRDHEKTRVNNAMTARLRHFSCGSTSLPHTRITSCHCSSIGCHRLKSRRLCRLTGLKNPPPELWINLIASHTYHTSPLLINCLSQAKIEEALQATRAEESTSTSAVDQPHCLTHVLYHAIVHQLPLTG